MKSYRELVSEDRFIPLGLLEKDDLWEEKALYMMLPKTLLIWRLKEGGLGQYSRLLNSGKAHKDDLWYEQFAYACQTDFERIQGYLHDHADQISKYLLSKPDDEELSDFRAILQSRVPRKTPKKKVEEVIESHMEETVVCCHYNSCVELGCEPIVRSEIRTPPPHSRKYYIDLAFTKPIDENEVVMPVDGVIEGLEGINLWQFLNFFGNGHSAQFWKKQGYPHLP